MFYSIIHANDYKVHVALIRVKTVVLEATLQERWFIIGTLTLSHHVNKTTALP